MDQLERQMFNIVNRNHQRREIMDRISRGLYYARMANRLNKISARRKK
jgi:hypothetical protein